MKELFKKFWPVIALGISIWAIWNYFKPTVYDIKIPEMYIENSLIDEMITDGSGQFLLLPDSIIINQKWDSISVSAGIEIENSDRFTVFSRKKSALPLEIIKFWKSGVAHVKAITMHSDFPDDTCCLEKEIWLRGIGYWDKGNIKPNLFQDNFGPSEVYLKLEKPNPKRIVALWQNFEITGSTNGRVVKIKIPAAAAKFKSSIIRIWACDDTFASPVCSIPLAGLLVAERYSQVASLDRTGEFKRMENIARTELIPDANLFLKFKKDLEKLYLNEDFKLNMAFGDIRFMNNNEVWLCNYFGKKVVFIFNKSAMGKMYVPNIKGQFKATATGAKFIQRGSKIKIFVPANSYEIIY